MVEQMTHSVDYHVLIFHSPCLHDVAGALERLARMWTWRDLVLT